MAHVVGAELDFVAFIYGGRLDGHHADWNFLSAMFTQYYDS